MAKYDIAILGGGTVGSMAFLDACSRGYKCILLERKKVGMQTNNASLGLSQVGPNYLYKDRMIVRMNAIDCGVFKEVAKSFVKIQPMIFPIFPDSKYPLWIWDGYLSAMDYVARFATTSRHSILSKERLLKREPFLKDSVLGGALYNERWFDPVAFSQAIVEAGVSLGGHVRQGAEVVAACHGSDKKFYAVGTKEGESVEWVYASMFINACGPWAPRVLREVFLIPDFETRMTRGTSIIINRKLCNADLIVFDENNKYISIMPLDGDRTLIGPTNVDISSEVKENPDLLKVETWEIEKLLRIAEEHLKVSLSEDDIIEIKTGLRPQLKHPHVRPNNISHDFVIIDHEKRDGYGGLMTIFGGKLSNQIRMSKELVDKVGQAKDRNPAWRIPELKIGQDGSVEEREVDDVRKIRRLYKKKLALSYKDDVRKIAWIRRVDALLFLIPFYITSTLRYIGRRVRR